MKKFTASLLAFICLALPAAAQSDPLGDRFRAPDGEIVCAEIPVLERGKFEPCAFRYLNSELAAYVGELALRRENRRAEQDARLWVWFTDPPTAPDCDALPELERAKFIFQCNVGQSGTGVLANFDENLTRLLTRRESLARRIEGLKREFASLETRQTQLDASATSTALPELQTVLERFDVISQESNVMERVAFELSRRPELTPIDGIKLVPAQAGVVLYGLDTPDDPVDTLAANNILVAIIETSMVSEERILLVHPQYGVVTAIKSDFYTDEE